MSASITEVLPSELLQRVLGFLASPVELCKCRLVCTTLRDVVDTPYVWAMVAQGMGIEMAEELDPSRTPLLSRDEAADAQGFVPVMLDTEVGWREYACGVWRGEGRWEGLHNQPHTHFAYPMRVQLDEGLEVGRQGNAFWSVYFRRQSAHGAVVNSVTKLRVVEEKQKLSAEVADADVPQWWHEEWAEGNERAFGGHFTLMENVMEGQQHMVSDACRYVLFRFRSTLLGFVVSPYGSKSNFALCMSGLSADMSPQLKTSLFDHGILQLTGPAVHIRSSSLIPVSVEIELSRNVPLDEEADVRDTFRRMFGRRARDTRLANFEERVPADLFRLCALVKVHVMLPVGPASSKMAALFAARTNDTHLYRSRSLLVATMHADGGSLPRDSPETIFLGFRGDHVIGTLYEYSATVLRVARGPSSSGRPRASSLD